MTFEPSSNIYCRANGLGRFIFPFLKLILLLDCLYNGHPSQPFPTSGIFSTSLPHHQLTLLVYFLIVIIYLEHLRVYCTVRADWASLWKITLDEPFGSMSITTNTTLPGR